MTGVRPFSDKHMQLEALYFNYTQFYCSKLFWEREGANTKPMLHIL